MIPISTTNDSPSVSNRKSPECLKTDNTIRRNLLVRIKNSLQVPISPSNKDRSKLPDIDSAHTNYQPKMDNYRQEFQYAPDGTLYYNSKKKDYFMLSFGPSNEQSANNIKSNSIKRSTIYNGIHNSNKDWKGMNATGISIQFNSIQQNQLYTQNSPKAQAKECERFHDNWRHKYKSEYKNRSMRITKNFLLKILSDNSECKEESTNINIRRKVHNYPYHSYIKHRKSIGYPDCYSYKCNNEGYKIKERTTAINTGGDIISVKENQSEKTSFRNNLKPNLSHRNKKEVMVAEVLANKYRNLYNKHAINTSCSPKRPIITKMRSPFFNYISEVRKKKESKLIGKKVQTDRIISNKPLPKIHNIEKIIIGGRNLPTNIHRESNCMYNCRLRGY